MTRPLRVRRAGVFERCMLLTTGLIGMVGLIAPAPISAVLGATLGAGETVYFAAAMIPAGLAGFWSVRHSQRERTPDQIESECKHEQLALLGLTAGWAGFVGVAAVVGGVGAVAMTILSCMLGVVAPVWRVIEIRRDLRKLHEALKDPKPADDPPPLAEGE